MELTLGQRQRLFTRLLGELIGWIYAQGWELSMGEGYVGDSINKPTEDTPHIRTGAHFCRLGIDLNLFIVGVWQPKAGKEWAMIGAKWLSLHPLCRWGGNLPSKDLNHFSLLLTTDPNGVEHY